MEYNTTRSHLLMPEYGRNVQGMADHLLTIEDPAERLRNAEIVVNVMATLNSHLMATEEYRHMFWDHLHRMCGYKLEVDSPYPKPDEEEDKKRPEPVPYPEHGMKHRHLGRNLQQLLDNGLKEENPEKRQGYTQAIGYYMKLAYGTWHKEPVHDDMIKSELKQLSEGTMDYEAGGFRVPFDPRPVNGPQGGNSFKAKKFNNKNKPGGFVNPNSTSAPPQQQSMGNGGGNFKKKYYKNKNK